MENIKELQMFIIFVRTTEQNGICSLKESQFQYRLRKRDVDIKTMGCIAGGTVIYVYFWRCLFVSGNNGNDK